MTYEKRLLDVLFLMHWNFATFRYSQDKATVDAHGYATILASAFCRYRLSISAWASALLVSTIPGNAKASMRETSDSAKVPRFFCAYWECLKLTHMDFIEFIMKTIFEIIGWFLGLIVKLVVGLFSLIFKGIASLFNR